MSYELCNTEGIFRISTEGFAQLLYLADRFGWIEMGTEPPSIEGFSECRKCVKEWNGAYLSNCLQEVTSEDAQNIANALEKASTVYSRFCLMSSCPKDEDFYQTTGDDETDRIISWFIGDKDEIEAFIGFCECGSFEIG